VVSFSRNGKVTIEWENGSETGTYQIFGNLVYVEFDSLVEIWHFTIRYFYLILVNDPCIILCGDGWPVFNQFDRGSADVDYGA
jgi:hypothetical protein